MATKSLAETIRGIAVGKKKRITAANANTARVTAARVLGVGNYSVRAVSATTFDVTRYAPGQLV